MVKLLGKLRRPVVVAAAIAGVAGCAGTGNTNTSVSGSNGFQYGQGVVVYKVGHRSTVGDVTGTTLQGRKLSLADYRGKYVVVVNYSDHQAQCHLPLPLADLAEARFRLVDIMGSERYDRDGRSLTEPGLYVDLAAWQYNVFRLERHSDRESDLSK